jgi:hypothetical protein
VNTVFYLSYKLDVFIVFPCICHVCILLFQVKHNLYYGQVRLFARIGLNTFVSGTVSHDVHAGTEIKNVCLAVWVNMLNSFGCYS